MSSARSCRCRASLARCTPALLELAERSGDDSSHRADEPYRRALIGIYSAARRRRSRTLTGTEALRHAVAPQRALSPTPSDFLADLITIRRRRLPTITAAPWSAAGSRR